MNFSIASRSVRVMVIDAIRQPEGWQWNSWYHDGSVPVTVCDLKPRALLRDLRRRGLLSKHSIGKVRVEDDGYNVVVLRRSNHKPIIALEYGAADVPPTTHQFRHKPLIESALVCGDMIGGFYGAIYASGRSQDDTWALYKDAAEVIHQNTGNGEAACCEMLDSAFGANFAAGFLNLPTESDQLEALEEAYQSVPAL